jgi:hypothetical protein
LNSLVRKLDSVPRSEFAGIFDRVTAVVELAGATNATRIENRMKIEIHRSQSISKDIKDLRLRRLRKHYWWKADQLDKLKEHDFAGRAIFEANRDPNGFIAKTLLYGREEAMRQIKAQKRAEIRAKAFVIPEKEIAERVSKGLSLRERLRRRWR